jgi:hypothetical protein
MGSLGLLEGLGALVVGAGVSLGGSGAPEETVATAPD